MSERRSVPREFCRYLCAGAPVCKTGRDCLFCTGRKAGFGGFVPRCGGVNTGLTGLGSDATGRHGGQNQAVKESEIALAKDKPTLLDWLGLRREPDFSKARWLGGLFGAMVIGAGFVGLVLVGLAAFRFLAALTGLDDFADAESQSAAIRNIGLVLAAIIGLPFLVWRSVVAQKQVDTAAEALFNDKINAAADDLHARRLATMNPGENENRWDCWQDDIVRRNAAIDRLEGLAIEQPDVAPRIARLLSIYVRELSGEHPPQVAPEAATPGELREWAWGLRACRSDMENAAQTLGRLQAITGADPEQVKIDLRGANLQGFDLQGAIFKEARLQGAQMQGAYLYGAQMQGADLSLAQMQGADLSWAAMDAATSLTDAALRGAALRGVGFSGAAISQAQVDEVFYDGSVRFPEGITRAAGRDAKLEPSDFENQWRAWQKSIGYDPEPDKA